MPVIVLMDRETSGDHPMIREWFENSRFATYEASNVFEALEQLSDFTIQCRPDVVLLDVESCDDELPLMTDLADLPTVKISGERRKGRLTSGSYYQADLGKVASQLNKLIPQ